MRFLSIYALFNSLAMVTSAAAQTPGAALDDELRALRGDLDGLRLSIEDATAQLLVMNQRLRQLEESDPPPGATPPRRVVPAGPIQQTITHGDQLEAQGFRPGSLYARFVTDQLIDRAKLRPGANPYSYVQLDQPFGFAWWVQQARQRGIKLAFRVMMLNSDSQYDGAVWMRDVMGWPGLSFTWQGRELWTPDHSDQRVREFFGALYQTIADRFSDDLEYVDGHGFGLWGEWHYNDDRGRHTRPEDPVHDYKWSIDVFERVFPDVPKLVTVKRPQGTPSAPGHPNAAEGCRYAISKGWGFRLDGAGDPFHSARDLGGAGYYEDALTYMGAWDVIGRVPVACEPAGTLNVGGWTQQGGVGGFDWWHILETQIDRYGICYLNNKGAPVVNWARPQFRELLEKMEANLARVK